MYLVLAMDISTGTRREDCLLVVVEFQPLPPCDFRIVGDIAITDQQTLF
jgi:hypothetical protein